jgi:hypothetical protein
MRIIRQLFVTGLALILSACGTLGAIGESGSALAAINISTLAAIENSSDRVKTAREIIDAALQAKSALETGATFATLVAQTRVRIAHSDAELSQKAALHLLLDRLTREVEQRISAGTIDPDEHTSVNLLLDAVIAAARAYAG